MKSKLTIAKRKQNSYLQTNIPYICFVLFCFVLFSKKIHISLPLKAMLLRKQSRMTTMLDQEGGGGGGGGVSMEICGTGLTAVKRKSMRNALVPGRRPRKFPAKISLKPLQNRSYAKKILNDSD